MQAHPEALPLVLEPPVSHSDRQQREQQGEGIYADPDSSRARRMHRARAAQLVERTI
jgi:hypothetical protein